jgi:hypothetical protein
MRRWLWTVAGLAVALASAGCATLAVGSHVERGLDFAQYQTFDWGVPDALPTGDARLDGSPVFNDRMQGAVERQLQARGLKLADGSPHLLLHYHATVARRINVNQVDREHGHCVTGDCPTDIVVFEEGTLVLDVLDARTGRLVWRGWAQHHVDDVLGDEQEMAETIDEAVARMIERFPRSL